MKELSETLKKAIGEVAGASAILGDLEFSLIIAAFTGTALLADMIL